jgi:hypothetical protein
MAIARGIHAVFGHFQNLNLLALIHDLRASDTAHNAWRSGSQLCPIAHGLPAGDQVQQLNVLGQSADTEVGCEFAARQLGADADAVLHFVRQWDGNVLDSGWLLWQLEAIWEERLADAEAMEELLYDLPDDNIAASLCERVRPALAKTRG